MQPFLLNGKSKMIGIMYNFKFLKIMEILGFLNVVYIQMKEAVMMANQPESPFMMESRMIGFKKKLI